MVSESHGFPLVFDVDDWVPAICVWFEMSVHQKHPPTKILRDFDPQKFAWSKASIPCSDAPGFAEWRLGVDPVPRLKWFFQLVKLCKIDGL